MDGNVNASLVRDSGSDLDNGCWPRRFFPVSLADDSEVGILHIRPADSTLADDQPLTEVCIHYKPHASICPSRVVRSHPIVANQIYYALQLLK